MNNLLIIIPAFNEEEEIKEVINKCLKYSEHVLVINDGSTDNTFEEIKKTRAICFNNETNKGKGYSLKRGFNYAIKNKFKTIITIDSDGQHDPDYIPELLNELEKGYDVIIGTRLRKHSSMPKMNRASNFILSFIVSAWSKKWIKDTQSGYKAIRVQSLRDLKLETNRYGTETELLIKLKEGNFKFGEIIVPTIYHKKDSIGFFKGTKRFFSILKVLKYKQNKKHSPIEILTTFKILRDRSMGWVSAFNFVMIGWLFFQNFENKTIGTILIILGVIVVTVVTILDYIFILPKEQEYYLKVNQEWQKKMIEVIEKK